MRLRHEQEALVLFVCALATGAWATSAAIGTQYISVSSVSSSYVSPTPAPTASGYDIFVIMGQSNAAGYGLPFGTLATDSRLKALVYTNATAVIDAVDPLPVPVWTQSVGFGVTAGQAHLPNLDAGRAVLLINCAEGGSSFASGRWVPGGSNAEQCKNATQTAWDLPGAHRVLAVFWHQGESDADGTTTAQYTLSLYTLVNYTRTTFAGFNATTPWVVGRMVSAWVGLNANRLQIDAAHAAVAMNIPYTVAINNSDLPPNDYLSDTVHFSTPSQRTMGTLYYNGYLSLAPPTAAPTANPTPAPTANPTPAPTPLPDCLPGTVRVPPGTSCLDCNPGYYAPFGNETDCLDCQAGRYSDNFHATTCTACAPGTANFRERLSTPCLLCDTGTYAPVAAMTACLTCDYPVSPDGTACLTPTPSPTATPTAAPTPAPGGLSAAATAGLVAAGAVVVVIAAAAMCHRARLTGLRRTVAFRSLQ
jgi:hypothetical protein